MRNSRNLVENINKGYLNSLKGVNQFEGQRENCPSYCTSRIYHGEPLEISTRSYNQP